MKLKSAFFAIVVFAHSLTHTVAEDFSFTVVDSSPTSWVARGFSDYTVSPDNGWNLVTSGSFGDPLTFSLSGPALDGTTVTDWGMTFDAPDDEPLVVGLYEDFQRWPFNEPGRPGLSFSSTGRLDNMASGFFEILEISYVNGTGEVESFAANFTHFGETNPNNYAIVEFRYNVDAIPEPTLVIPVLATAVLLAGRRRTKKMI